MGKRSITIIVLAVLLAPIAAFSAARWLGFPWGASALRGGASDSAEVAADNAEAAAEVAAAAPVASDPSPVFVGDTWTIAARAIDDTASMPMNRALVGLARRYLGRPYNAYSLDRGTAERLQLDLTRFDCFLFIEQLLALVNSRDVTTQTEAVGQFGDHVRRLRYMDGQVDYCRRHHYFSRWAEAAERQGYLVNITRYLPGALSRERPLNFMSNHAGSYEPMKVARNRNCITALEGDLSVSQAYIPLAKLGEALPSLRSGDLFGLVTQVEGLDVTHVGMVEVSNGAVDAIHAAPGNGVIRSYDLANYAGQVDDVIGLMVLRPMPRPEGPDLTE